MRKTQELDPKVEEFRQSAQRTWLMWGLLPLGAACMLLLLVSEAFAATSNVDEHILERGFQAVLAVSACLFLVGFWLDGRWTNSERLAKRVWQAAGGDSFAPSRSQLAAQADIVFRTVSSSSKTLTIIGAAIAVSAVISVWAGLGLGGGIQILIVGLSYQLFLVSRRPYYEELLSAAARGELVVAEDDANRRKKR
jgi:hypothetical protein